MLMKHTGHGGLADLPDLEYWRAQGWEPTDEAPPEPDLLRDPPPAAEPLTEPETPPTAGSSAVPSEKPAAAAKTKKETDRG